MDHPDTKQVFDPQGSSSRGMKMYPRAFYQAVDGGEDVVVSVRHGAAGCRLSFEHTKKQASVISCKLHVELVQ